ncbi:hypothetical protein BACFIN_04715 [Bacteroides finegoldii DSM 17565]|nr:hypothetical protein BACFIN_04715 [Bacteroides finegoldii DSM 17565]
MYKDRTFFLRKAHPTMKSPVYHMKHTGRITQTSGNHLLFSLI